jgi:hypothetical protein
VACPVSTGGRGRGGGGDDQRDDRDFAERGFASEMASRRRKSTVLEGEEEFEPFGCFPTAEATNEGVGMEHSTGGGVR